ncbi:hypothetical protein KC19_9G082000 [Ceratodon purpureus]|uniref:Uncharacterized protein n=1 Tax=Ceratodon purpureus TaxID=3225 RepID=A0A8T0GRW6_CERPU|nr:hypothetical protein KC19_9G082000 [Ceratodon purpureus]
MILWQCGRWSLLAAKDSSVQWQALICMSTSPSQASHVLHMESRRLCQPGVFCRCSSVRSTWILCSSVIRRRYQHSTTLSIKRHVASCHVVQVRVPVEYTRRVCSSKVIMSG